MFHNRCVSPQEFTMFPMIWKEGWKYIFAFACLIFALSGAYDSLSSAHANIGPTVSHGQLPYESFYGAGSNGTNIFTVPTGEVFILTTFLLDHNSLSFSNSFNCTLNIDGQTVISGSMNKNFGSTGNSNTMAVSSTSFVSGNAHLVVPAGSTVTIGGSSCNTRYYIEGYYAHP